MQSVDRCRFTSPWLSTHPNFQGGALLTSASCMRLPSRNESMHPPRGVGEEDSPMGAMSAQKSLHVLRDMTASTIWPSSGVSSQAQPSRLGRNPKRLITAR